MLLEVFQAFDRQRPSFDFSRRSPLGFVGFAGSKGFVVVRWRARFMRDLHRASSFPSFLAGCFRRIKACFSFTQGSLAVLFVLLALSQPSELEARKCVKECKPVRSCKRIQRCLESATKRNCTSQQTCGIERDPRTGRPYTLCKIIRRCKQDVVCFWKTECRKAPKCTQKCR